MRADRDVLAYSQPGKRLRDLERARDSAPRQQVRGEVRDLLALVEHVALARLEEARDDREQRGLAGPVGSDQRDDLAFVRRQRGAVEREQPAETARDIIDAQDLAHARRLNSPAMPRGANATTRL